jgi:hypothetical protein
VLNLSPEWKKVVSFKPQPRHAERMPSDSQWIGICVSAYHCKESNHDNPDVYPIVSSLYVLSYVHKACNWWFIQFTDLKLLKTVPSSDSGLGMVNKTSEQMNIEQLYDFGSENIG